MTDTDMQNTINDLTRKVSQFTKSSKPLQPTLKSITGGNTKLYMFIGVPILIVLVLYYMKPTFLSYYDDYGNKKVNTNRLLIILIILEVLAMFLYKKKF